MTADYESFTRNKAIFHKSTEVIRNIFSRSESLESKITVNEKILKKDKLSLNRSDLNRSILGRKKFDWGGGLIKNNLTKNRITKT